MSEKWIVLFGIGLIGKAVSKALLEEGYSLICADKDIQTIKESGPFVGPKYKGRVEFYPCDATRENDVSRLLKNFDYISGVVNTTYPRNEQYGRPVPEVTYDSFAENISLQVGSAFVILKCSAQHFLEHRAPISIINFSSIYGVVPPRFELYKGTAMTSPVEYSVSKSSIINLSQYFVKYVRNSNFRVNCISPGGIFDNQDERFVIKYQAETLGKGMLQASEICGTVKFLLSDDSFYINGQNIIVDDGFTIS